MKVIAWPAFKTQYKNPYNWLLYTQMSRQGAEVAEFSFSALLQQKYDLFHLHWPVETIVRHPNLFVAGIRAGLMLFLIDWVRYRGTRIIWTIHDEKPHLLLHPKLAAWFQSELVKRIDGYINLCEPGQTFVQNSMPLLKNCPHTIIHHGHYRGVYSNTIDSIEAKISLNIPENYSVLMFFGMVKDYKNIPKLIGVFQNLNPQNWLLVIAGQPATSQLREEVIQAAANHPKVKLKLEFIPDDRVQTYLKSADLVVLPFRETLNSGSAILALSFDCPVLVPNLGALTELQSLVGTDWVKLYDGEFTSTVLEEALNWATKTVRSQQAPLEALNWPQLSQQTLNFYEKVIGYSST